MSDKVPIPTGQILILREQFDKAAQDPNKPLGQTRTATLLVAALDELLHRREKEAADGANREQAV